MTGLCVSAVAGIAVVAAISTQAPDLVCSTATVPFVDEGARDTTFVAFRAALLRIIDRRDVVALLEAVDPGIKNTFGDDNGVEAFKRIWELDRTDSTLWGELRTVLTLGGTFEGPDNFVAPYVFSTWPSEFDPFDHVALIGDAVRIRAAPRANAPVLAMLSRCILQRRPTSDVDEWFGVVLPNDRTGFVSAGLTRSSIDYRAYFSRSNGRWRMVVLIAGD